jgi:predicted dehydrogenase
MKYSGGALKMEKIKAGIIGCGGIANGKHLPAIKKLGEMELTAFCDLIPERAQKAAREYGTPDAKVFTDYKQLLETDVSVVYVLTPNRAHSFITVDALEAGKNVMCEKPMAINYSEALKMAQAAKKSGKLLTIGYQNRYRPDSMCLKRECDAGVLGDIYYARAKALRRRAVPTWGVFLNEHEQGGGPLIDIGTHSLDLTLWMMNNYRPKFAVGTTYHKLNKDRETGNSWGDWDPDKFTVEDSAFGFVVMENGATISLETSWALNTLDVGEALTMLCGTKAGADMFGGLRINGVKNGLQYTTAYDLHKGGVDFYAGDSADPADVEQRVFVDALRGKRQPVVLPEQALTVTRILEAVYTSAREGKPYYFD